MSDDDDKQVASGDEVLRLVHVNDNEKNRPFKFCDNSVTTSKYTVLTFLPKNLYEQFRRLANVYFLIVAALQQIDGLSPTGKYTTLIPLLLVLSVSAAKEIYEDYQRHKQDKKVNQRSVLVLRNGQWEPTLWRDLKTGEIVKVLNREFLPADLVLLGSSEPQGIAYIETANLDGETNLKIRQGLDETTELASAPDDNIDKLKQLKAIIHSELPNKRLYNFDASLEMDGEKFSLSPKQLLLRGAQLRNTAFAIGVAVFTGKDTKLVRNSASPPLKRSNIEKSANFQILFLFALELTMSIVCAIGYSIWQQSTGQTAWYLQFPTEEGSSASWLGFVAFLTFFILFNTIVPISLYVSIEMCKVFQAYFINNDLRMYYEKNDTPALARTSNLNEELGQVEYIFSDKTGTLTRNQMQFRQCTVGDVAYGDMSEGYTGPEYMDTDEAEGADPFVQFEDKRLLKLLKKGDKKAVEYATLLAVCHTVIPEIKDDGTTVYEASSPDEAALVAAARVLNYRFANRTMKSVTIEVDGKKRKFELLNVLEFNSTRKRMSVIVKNPEGEIILYCKGADTVIMERLSAKERKKCAKTVKHLERFAATGLRTLLCARAVLDPKKYKAWNKTFHEAAVALVDRNDKLDAAAETIEKELELLGSTAIEDKLQVGVPDTIATLARAGIKIWVLTGDKQETAINIAYSCKLFTHAMEVIILNEYTLKNCSKRIEALLKQHPHKSERLALVVDGHSLEHALHESLELRFLELGQRCKAVVACRVSPAQKAEVVNLVRNNVGAISLAVGDGANDVSMIQAAHVGIGISGEEGLQAARSADYSIAQFRFLQPLLLIHGRLAYRRVARLINYSFYKNLVLNLTQFWFTMYSGFSGQSLYEQWTLASYNAIFTAFPIIFYGVFDKDVSDESVYRFPQLYKLGHSHYYYSLKVFAGWMLNGLLHSAILFFIVIHAAGFESSATTASGRVFGLYESGVLLYTAALGVVTLKLALESSYWNWLNHLTVWGSFFVLWFSFQLVYSTFGLGWARMPLGWDITWTFYIIADTAVYWFSLFLVLFVALTRDISWKYVRRTYFPQVYHIVQEIELLERQSGTQLVIENPNDKAIDENPPLINEDDDNDDNDDDNDDDDDVMEDESSDAVPLKEKKKKSKSSKKSSKKADKMVSSSSRLLDESEDGASAESEDLVGNALIDKLNESSNDDEDDIHAGINESESEDTHPHHGFAFSQSAGAVAAMGKHLEVDENGVKSEEESGDAYADMSSKSKSKKKKKRSAKDQDDDAAFEDIRGDH